MSKTTTTAKKTRQKAEEPHEAREIKVEQQKIADLIPDDRNFNRGKEFGQHLIEKSLRELGAGRSILIDKNNRIIAGNKTTENAAAIDMEDVIVVETDGTKLVAVKRTDIDLDSEQGRRMALADNATSAANLEWDEDALKAMEQEMDNFDPEEWGVISNEYMDIDKFFEENYNEKKKEMKIEVIISSDYNEQDVEEMKGIIKETLKDRTGVKVK